MRRQLLMALWPAGQAAIAAATVTAARRGAPHSMSRPGGRAGRAARRRLPSPAEYPGWMPGLIRLGIISCAGGISSYGLMAVLGQGVVTHGPALDRAVAEWTARHRVDRWAAVMERLGKIGNTWTTWGAAGAAAACLATTWRTRKWLPPAALGAAIVVDHYATLALRHRFHRPGPPGSPRGTFPSGGCDRVVLFYGLIAYLLWREFSGTQQGKDWAIGSVAALAFNEAYSRQYLNKHWLTDIISGLVFGALQLAPFIAAVRLIAGPPPTGVRSGRSPVRG